MTKSINKIVIVKEMDEMTDPQDFENMDKETLEKYNKGYLWQIGVFVRAEIIINNTIQHIQSGGLWGVWSNSDQEYINQIALEELEQLKDVLKELGFTELEMSNKLELVA